MLNYRRKLSISEKTFLKSRVDKILEFLPKELGATSSAWDRWSKVYGESVRSSLEGLQPITALNGEDIKLLGPAYVFGQTAPYYGTTFQRGGVLDGTTFNISEKDEILKSITPSTTYSAMLTLVNHLLGDSQYLKDVLGSTEFNPKRDLLFDPETGFVQIDGQLPIPDISLENLTQAYAKEIVESTYDALLTGAAHIGSRSGALDATFNTGLPGKLIDKKVKAMESRIFKF